MSKIEKAIERLKSKPKDFTYEEAKKILNYFGYIEDNRGRTSGSAVCFRNISGDRFNLHKPHPSNVLKEYQIKKLIEYLKEGGRI